MDNKDLIIPGNDSVNPLTTQDLPAEMVELSEKDLQQVIGGVVIDFGIDLGIDPGEWQREISVLDNGGLIEAPKSPGALVTIGAASSTSDNLYLVNIISPNGGEIR